jgi:hypothetical protein
MSGEAPEEPESCWTCGGDWEECRHNEPSDPGSAMCTLCGFSRDMEANVRN